MWQSVCQRCVPFSHVLRGAAAAKLGLEMKPLHPRVSLNVERGAQARLVESHIADCHPAADRRHAKRVEKDPDQARGRRKQKPHHPGNTRHKVLGGVGLTGQLLAGQAAWANDTLRRDCRNTKPRTAKPISIVALVEGSARNAPQQILQSPSELCWNAQSSRRRPRGPNRLAPF